MADDGNGAYRITTGVLYEQIDGLKKDIAAMRTEVALGNAAMGALVAAATVDRGRIEKLETRFNGVLMGLGVGIITGAGVVITRVIG